jgi:hypothetical protein
VLGQAPTLSPGTLRNAIARAAAAVAPPKAKDRREHGAKNARVERWREGSGNAGPAGRELPPALTLAMDQRITWRARQLQAAGLEGGMDVLRGRAALDLIGNQDSRPPAVRGTTPADTGADHPAGPYRASGPGPAGGIPAGSAGRNHLTVPLATLLGRAGRAARRNPRPRTGGPVAGPRPRRRLRGQPQDLQVPDRDRQPRPGQRPRLRPAPTPQPRTAAQEPAARRDRPARQHSTRVHLHPPGPGTPGGYGTWRFTTGIPGQRAWIITIDPIPAGPCDHRYQAPGHDPGVKLRHLTKIRHATCTAPMCERPSGRVGFEHNIPYEKGGRTCLCNTGPPCKR